MALDVRQQFVSQRQQGPQLSVFDVQAEVFASPTGDAERLAVSLSEGEIHRRTADNNRESSDGDIDYSEVPLIVSTPASSAS